MCTLSMPIPLEDEDDVVTQAPNDSIAEWLDQVFNGFLESKQIQQVRRYYMWQLILAGQSVLMGEKGSMLASASISEKFGNFVGFEMNPASMITEIMNMVGLGTDHSGPELKRVGAEMAEELKKRIEEHIKDVIIPFLDAAGTAIRYAEHLKAINQLVRIMQADAAAQGKERSLEMAEMQAHISDAQRNYKLEADKARLLQRVIHEQYPKQFATAICQLRALEGLTDHEVIIDRSCTPISTLKVLAELGMAQKLRMPLPSMEIKAGMELSSNSFKPGGQAKASISTKGIFEGMAARSKADILGEQLTRVRAMSIMQRYIRQKKYEACKGKIKDCELQIAALEANLYNALLSWQTGANEHDQPYPVSRAMDIARALLRAQLDKHRAMIEAAQALLEIGIEEQRCVPPDSTLVGHMRLLMPSKTREPRGILFAKQK